MAFYYRLARYAERMVRPPNRYTFKKHYIMCLPKGIFDYLQEALYYVPTEGNI